MPEFKLVWEIELTADSVFDAVRRAINIQRDPKSTATFFKVLSKDPVEHDWLELKELAKDSRDCERCGGDSGCGDCGDINS